MELTFFGCIEIVKEAEGVKYGMVSTQVHGMLLIAFALVDVVTGMISMLNQLLNLLIGRHLVRRCGYRFDDRYN